MINSSGRNEHLQHFAEVGDSIRLQMLQPDTVRLTESITRTFGTELPDERHKYFEGTIVHVWTIHHELRRSDPRYQDSMVSHLPTRDREIGEALNWVSYKSPSDSVDIEVPIIPEEETDDDGGIMYGRKRRRTPGMSTAMKQRKAAIRDRKRQLEQLWSAWTKPLLKPGDVVALIRPLRSRSGSTLLTNADKDSRILLVYRFWIESDERVRHAIWIPGGVDLTSCCEISHPLDSFCRAFDEPGTHFYLPISTVNLIAMHLGRRGPDRFSPVSSIGLLENGEKYCVYRFLLFWDGFEVQTGKSASGDGVYLVCLNLPLEARSSPNAVRVVSLTPPGVKAEAAIFSIMDDLKTGMTEGFLDVDATGEKRRIFLDLVGIVGDTPAINAALDVIGHTGSSFCHVCRSVRRSATTIGSRYTSLSSHGMATAHARRFHQQQAVRDSGARRETCTQLGMKQCPSRAQIVLHDLRSAIISTKGQVPLTKDGCPVVPSILDPYRACLIAPDHLLTSHMRDCLNLAIQLMPTPEFRATFESFLLASMRDCHMSPQNRLIDPEKRCLYSMSMSDLYAVGIVAYSALQHVPGKSYTNFVRGVDLVGSCTSLIGKLLLYPYAERDGNEAVHCFEKAGVGHMCRVCTKRLRRTFIESRTFAVKKMTIFFLLDDQSGTAADLAAAQKRKNWATKR